MKEMVEFDTIAVAIDAVRSGLPVVIVDDEDRENEGDVVVPAQFVTPRLINFMVTHARGLVCVALLPRDVERLGIPMMTDLSRENRWPDECQSVYGLGRSGRGRFDRHFGARSRPHDRCTGGCNQYGC